MNSLNSFIYKYFVVMVTVLLAAFACKNNTHSPITNTPVIKVKAGRSDTAHIHFKNPIESDTTLQKHVASDSVNIDSTHTRFEETTRKLDMRYFKKSFNLHRRSYITLNWNKSLPGNSLQEKVNS